MAERMTDDRIAELLEMVENMIKVDEGAPDADDDLDYLDSIAVARALPAALSELRELRGLILALSDTLADEGDGGWSTDGLHNIRRRTADALGENCPDWMLQYRTGATP